MDSAGRNFLGLVGISATLGTYPVCGFAVYVLAPLLSLSPRAPAHIGPICLLPAILLTALIAASVGLAVKTLGFQASASRRLSRQVRALALPAPPELSITAKAAGLDGRVTMLDSPEQSSFVYGMLAPRVAIDRRFLESLTAEELRATLEHERYHVRHLDPLRAMLGRPWPRRSSSCPRSSFCAFATRPVASWRPTAAPSASAAGARFSAPS